MPCVCYTLNAARQLDVLQSLLESLPLIAALTVMMHEDEFQHIYSVMVANPVSMVSGWADSLPSILQMHALGWTIANRAGIQSALKGRLWYGFLIREWNEVV
jgi:hypothetical protein